MAVALSMADIDLKTQFILGRELNKHIIEKDSCEMVSTCSLLNFRRDINAPGYVTASNRPALSADSERSQAIKPYSCGPPGYR